ncbi:MAG: HEAT repeat domain-containing protein [Verrucomicrobiales bacterium]|nr:HEAT repeat domain-containing protein [Verrucomicrobiales bacterium]
MALALYYAFREPRFEGRTLAAWLDSMDSADPDHPSAPIRDVPARQALASAPEEALPALERAIEVSVAHLEHSQNVFFRLSALWAQLGKLLPDRLGLAPPQPDDVRDKVAGNRLFWAVGLIMDLSPDAQTGLSRLERLAGSIPADRLIAASSAFRTLRDPDGSLVSNLVARLRLPPRNGDGRAVWLACLRHLGSPLATNADVVRALTRDPDPRVRFQALQSLGSLDSRDDTTSFLQAAATTPEDRKAVMSAFIAMGSRARPAEAFIRETLQDPDWLTSFFAQVALKGITNAATNAARP